MQLIDCYGIGHWEEDLGTRRIGDKGKDLFQVLTSCPQVPLFPIPNSPFSIPNSQFPFKAAII